MTDPTYEAILVDEPAPRVRRITLNRPEKRNAISTPLRAELFHALQVARNRCRKLGFIKRNPS